MIFEEREDIYNRGGEYRGREKAREENTFRAEKTCPKIKA